jgi:hypothetical protein
MADGNSIINLGDLAKPATVLIEKVSNAVGVWYEPRRIKNQAKAEVEAEKTKVLAGIELSDIQQRGMERLVHQEAKKQKNIEDITAQAASSLTDDAKVDNLEEDWISHFFDKCEKVSDAQMQSLWSSLLCGEATEPGTFSKRTVDFVSSMDKKDAELFRQFCQFTWMIGEPRPLIFDLADDIYKKNGIGFDAIKHLQDIGLVTLEMTSGYILRGFGKSAYFYYFDELTKIELPTDDPKMSIKVGKAFFTQTGKELFRVCDANKNPEFYAYALTQLSNSGAVATKAT